MHTIKLSTISKQPIRVEYMGYEAMLYPTESFGYTVNFPSAMLSATQKDLEVYIDFLQYVQYFVSSLNSL